MIPIKTCQSSRSSSLSSVIGLPENLVEAVQTQLDLISSFRLWLDRHNLTGCSHSSSSEVKAHLTSVVGGYKGRIEYLKSRYTDTIRPENEKMTPESAISDNAWKLQAHPKKSSDRPVLLVRIGSNGDPIEVRFEKKSELESAMGDKYFDYITKIFQAFEQAEKELIQLFKISREIEEERAALSQPPEETVQKHIDLLKEYNDMRDIGQQLIGLIADNRGVSIGALYEDGQYGVTADD